jgi:hypothetical protein
MLRTYDLEQPYHGTTLAYFRRFPGQSEPDGEAQQQYCCRPVVRFGELCQKQEEVASRMPEEVSCFPKPRIRKTMDAETEHLCIRKRDCRFVIHAFHNLSQLFHRD